jgi:hypothetical protein
MRWPWGKKKRAAPSEDELVPVANLGVLEAELVAGRIREAGIEAVVNTNDTSGTLPQLGYSEGATVMVRRRDAAAAADVVREVPE